MFSVQKINAYCGLSNCPTCTQGLGAFMPHNFVCSFVGEHDAVYRRRSTVYDAFLDQLKYDCLRNEWNYYEIIRGVFPNQGANDYVMHLVSEYHRLDSETQNQA